ncbi:DJ-1/PfpI family protein [Methanolapillus millepedarum]|uniref:DJ-1/PfpI domain-containing protein n=1 Tax=Methanolapillus millepedarum TaxID=3028296 RepID=A0AA97A371_9EURY|nr:hypothetical protein MsAc7_02670 [Methanosarcinaceae archaeon Ac7]
MKSNKILMVIAPERFRDEEFFRPKEVFEKNGFSVTVASTKPGVAQGAKGGSYKVDIPVKDAKADDYDAIAISGGAGSKAYLWNDPALHTLLKDAYAKNKIVSAICISPVVLAKAGLLSGKNATVFNDPDAISAMNAAGSKLRPEHVVRDGRLITGDGPDVSYDFGEEILKAIRENKE